MKKVCVLYYNAEFDYWSFVVMVDQECEMCSKKGSYVGWTITSDGDSVGNCESCLNEWATYVSKPFIIEDDSNHPFDKRDGQEYKVYPWEKALQ